VDTVGLYDAATGAFFLKNANGPGAADLTFGYGPPDTAPLAGDWNGDGVDTVGIYVPSTGAWFPKNSNASGTADLVFGYGPPNAMPVSGDWGS